MLQPHQGEATLQKRERQTPKERTARLASKSWGSLGLLPRLLGLTGEEPGPTTLLKSLSCFWHTGVTRYPVLGHATCSAGPSAPILSASSHQQGDPGKHCPGIMSSSISAKDL